MDIATYILCKKYCDSNAATLTPEQAASAIANYITAHPGAIVTSDTLNNYATKVWIENKGYLTAHQDLSSKQDKLTAGDNITIVQEGSIVKINAVIPTPPTYDDTEVRNLIASKQDSGSYVTTNTTQTISGAKTFSAVTSFSCGDSPAIKVGKNGNFTGVNTTIGYDGVAVKDGGNKYIKIEMGQSYTSKCGFKVNAGDGVAHYISVPASDGTIALTKDLIPLCPTTTDGTFTLKCVVADGVATYSWIQA